MNFNKIIDKKISIVENDVLFNKYTDKTKGFRIFESDDIIYFSNINEGIEFIFNRNNILNTIHFYGVGHSQYSTFKDELPYGMNLTDSYNEVVTKFEKYELKRGGTEILPILGKSNNWIMYLIDENCYRFEFKDEKIYLLTLSNQYK